jgi:hypothetical protein
MTSADERERRLSLVEVLTEAALGRILLAYEVLVVVPDLEATSQLVREAAHIEVPVLGCFLLHQAHEKYKETTCFAIDHPEIVLLGRDNPVAGPGDIMGLTCIQMCHLLGEYHNGRR